MAVYLSISTVRIVLLLQMTMLRRRRATRPKALDDWSLLALGPKEDEVDGPVCAIRTRCEGWCSVGVG